MTKITVNAEMMAKLHHLTEPTELCDESGKILGHFYPAVPGNGTERQPRSPFSKEELERRRQLRISEEEIDRRVRQGGGRTLAEILADLEKRA
jgi:hypothetical protein